ncbi:hypothetical protein [Devosia sp.]|nr:hypothetical protein [Devosia sp.]
MDEFNTHDGIAPHSWLQHHLPWLALFALVLGLFGDHPELGFEPDELNG